MFDSLLIAAALLTPANRDTADRLPPVSGVSFATSTTFKAEREGRIIPPGEAVALATRPAVQVRKPYIWNVAE
jgi:hypothetical protein